MFEFCNHHLGNAHAAFDREVFCAEIGEDDLDFAAIVGIDGAGRIQNRDAMFDSKAGAGAHLRFVAIGQGDGQARRDERAFTGREFDRFLQCRR